MKQKPNDQTVFNFSKLQNGKSLQLRVEELTANVKKLVRHAYYLSESQAQEECPLLMNKGVSHKFFEKSGEAKWYTGKVISQVKYIENLEPLCRIILPQQSLGVYRNHLVRLSI